MYISCLRLDILSLARLHLNASEFVGLNAKDCLQFQEWDDCPRSMIES